MSDPLPLAQATLKVRSGYLSLTKDSMGPHHTQGWELDIL